MTNDDGSVDIRIELPLPIDLTGTLINIIGLTWPNAVIKDDGNDKQWRNENCRRTRASLSRLSKRYWKRSSRRRQTRHK